MDTADYTPEISGPVVQQLPTPEQTEKQVKLYWKQLTSHEFSTITDGKECIHMFCYMLKYDNLQKLIPRAYGVLRQLDRNIVASYRDECGNTFLNALLHLIGFDTAVILFHYSRFTVQDSIMKRELRGFGSRFIIRFLKGYIIPF